MHTNVPISINPNNPRGRKVIRAKGKIIEKRKEGLLEGNRWYLMIGIDQSDLAKLRHEARNYGNRPNLPFSTQCHIPDKIKEFKFEDEWEQFAQGDTCSIIFGIADVSSQFWAGQNHVSVTDIQFDKVIVPHQIPPPTLFEKIMFDWAPIWTPIAAILFFVWLGIWGSK